MDHDSRKNWRGSAASAKNFKIFQFWPVLAVFVTALLTASQTTNAQSVGPGKIHEPVIAGTWYPGTESELKSLIVQYLARKPASTIEGPISALIVPHAGYIFSGSVAASSYALLQGKEFDSVIVIGPSHHVRFTGAATYDCAGFRTPLGVVPVDTQLLSALIKRDSRIKSLPEAFEKEHSIEIQLPFLQTTVPRVKLVPLLMSDYGTATCQWLSDAIVDACKGKSVLIVASSDLSHYHPCETAREMDERLLQKVRALDPQGLAECLDSDKCEACGRGPILTTMLAAKKLGVDNCKVLETANSGDVTGEKSSSRGVVGYASGVFYKSGADRDSAEKPQKAGIDLGLTQEERKELHSTAWKVIDSKCKGIEVSRSESSSPRLKEPRGAFVTIYKKGELRGCIGQVIARMPLAEAVAQMAEAAAFQDPRFSPVRQDELKDLKIEISVLTPFRKIESPDEIELGKDGLIVKQGPNMGLLLPQVATEYKWNRTEFMEHTCLKAGLPRSCSKDKETEVFVFSADVF